MLKSIGSVFIILGLATIVLGFMDVAPKFLTWIYDWGQGTAWAIKIGIVVLGAALYVLGNKKAEPATGNS